MEKALKVEEKPKKKITREDPDFRASQRWLKRAMPSADEWNDWYEMENKWRDNIVPQNND